MTGGPTRPEQAAAAWAALRRGATRDRWRAIRVREGPWLAAAAASLWPLSQVVHAAVDLLGMGLIEQDELDRLLRGAQGLRAGAGYAPRPGLPRYYDDNAWWALALVQAHLATGERGYLDAALGVFGFLHEGERDGGIYWVEHPRTSRHTCSTAPTAQLAYRLALLGVDPEAAAFGDRALAFLDDALRRPDGLYADHIDDDGTVEPTIWAYNQGTPVGAAVLRARVAGDPAGLDAARATADVALDHFAAEDRLWQQPPAFNAIFLRNLLALEAVAPGTTATDVLDRYLDRAWDEARDGSGWFTRGGIGRYERGGSLDQAAFVQLFALASGPADRWIDNC